LAVEAAEEGHSAVVVVEVRADLITLLLSSFLRAH
jgi:hypothetical protein